MRDLGFSQCGLGFFWCSIWGRSCAGFRPHTAGFGALPVQDLASPAEEFEFSQCSLWGSPGVGFGLSPRRIWGSLGAPFALSRRRFRCSASPRPPTPFPSHGSPRGGQLLAGPSGGGGRDVPPGVRDAVRAGAERGVRAELPARSVPGAALPAGRLPPAAGPAAHRALRPPGAGGHRSPGELLQRR